ncbi:MAG TPA: MarR family transcriptional regulator [Acidimicrobiales bacterium]|nr:MarR family transcriptional regulator [Acidimicrobiales bacterium]
MAGAERANREAPERGARLTYLVKQLELAIRADMDVMARAHGLTTLQYTALTVLRRHPGMSGAQLARRSFVSAQAGSEMIATLERKGLISRQPDPGNRRILRVSLTSEGDAVVDACDGWMDKLEKQMVHDLGAPERRALRAALDSCIRALSPPRAGARR